MKTLVIYDNEGTIFLCYTGRHTAPVGLQHMEIEVPEDKLLTKIDVSVIPHQPMFEDIPKSEVEYLRERVQQSETALVELAELLMEVLG